MSGFYQDIITDLSWELLNKLKGRLDFVLIGGWAVYLYTKAIKSKDIDLIVDYEGLTFLQREFNVAKNDRLKKYEVKEGGVDIDIYLPFYSNIGFPLEEILKNTQVAGDFKIPRKEILIILKQKAYIERKAAVKGQKDKIDIISLASMSDFDFGLYKKILHEHGLESYRHVLEAIFKEPQEVKELSLNMHQFSKVRKEVLKKLDVF